MTDIQRRVIRADGSVIPLPKPLAIESIRQMIGADVLHVVSLRHLGEPLQVMLVDDNGIARGLPVNEQASAIYADSCRKTGVVPKIYGDACVTSDSDFSLT